MATVPGRPICPICLTLMQPGRVELMSGTAQESWICPCGHWSGVHDDTRPAFHAAWLKEAQQSMIRMRQNT